MANSAIRPIRFDFAGALGLEGGLTQAMLDELKPALEQAREEVAEDCRLFDSNGTVPIDKEPLDAGFLDMPAKLLAEYEQNREASELGRILSCAKRLRDQVDRFVVLGIGGSYMGARALLDSCCEPYFNELNREQRGGRPRIYFEGNNVDNDHSASLLKMLGSGQPFPSDDERWALVVISKSGGTMETAIAFRQFLAALTSSCGNASELVFELVVPVTGEVGKLASLADELKVKDRFLVPDGVGGRFSVLSAVGLLPAAILGIDVVALLKGAVEVTERFRSADIGDNPVLDYVAISHALESHQGVDQRVMSVWSKSLETAGLWYDQLLAESLGKHEKGALPLTVVNTRDLHSRAQQHQEGKRDKLMTNVILDSWRDDPVKVGYSERNQDGLNQIGEKALPEVMTAAIAGTNQAYQEDQRPTVDLYLPGADEASLGQYFQMMMIATVVEGRLIGINPYGQPGVEKYKQNMKRIMGM